MHSHMISRRVKTDIATSVCLAPQNTGFPEVCQNRIYLTEILPDIRGLHNLLQNLYHLQSWGQSAKKEVVIEIRGVEIEGKETRGIG